jgi:uncharacterized membrane protein YgcG
VTLTDEEAGRLIHLRNEVVLITREFRQHGFRPGLAEKLRALGKVLDNEPAPSEGFKNLATRKSAWTEEECRTMANGALLAMVLREGGMLHVRTQEIFDAAAALGTLALALSDDDSLLTVTGMKKQ